MCNLRFFWTTPWQVAENQSSPCFDRPNQAKSWKELPSDLLTLHRWPGGTQVLNRARLSQVTHHWSHWCALSELVTHPAEGWNFARFVIHDKLRGFLPVFWDVSRVSMHAVGDIGAVVEWLSKMQTFQADAKSSLAVLHNLNTMVNLFQASNWVTESMLATGNKGFGLHRLFVDKTAYLCRLGWHSHGSQYPRNSFGQTFEFKNSWGLSSKSADSPLILSALCHYTSWIIRSIVTSVFVPITPAWGKTLPPLDLAKSPGIQAQLLAHQSSYKIVCEGFANKPSVANILLSFESMANL